MMSVCSRCGKEFDLTRAKRRTGRLYGAGVYDGYYPDGDVCDDCAIEEMSSDYETGAEIMELSGRDWDD